MFGPEEWPDVGALVLWREARMMTLTNGRDQSKSIYGERLSLEIPMMVPATGNDLKNVFKEAG